MPEFVRHNVNLNADPLSEEGAWILARVHENGYPEAKQSYLMQMLYGMRKKVAGNSSKASDFKSDPQVDAFLANLRQVADGIDDFVRHIQRERVASEGRIQDLEEQLGQQSEAMKVAQQLSDLLKGKKK